MPTALGLWRTGFAVSYVWRDRGLGYLYLQKTSGVAKLHATAPRYGVACAYLLLRGATTEMAHQGQVRVGHGPPQAPAR